MPTTVSRRTFISAAGALLIPPLSIASPKDERRMFLADAIKDVDKNRAAKEKEKAAAGQKGGMALFVMPPRVIPFLDWDFFYIDEGLNWVPEQDVKLSAVRVPKGFVTDLASIPQALWWALPRTGRYVYPAIVHDYLYWNQKTSRKEADDILLQSMIELNVSALKRDAIYAGVRTPVGQAAWDNNAQAKERGERRVLQKFPENSLMPWDKWKATPNVFTS
jgi:Protein of unknown function (DUF1353)